MPMTNLSYNTPLKEEYLSSLGKVTSPGRENALLTKKKNKEKEEDLSYESSVHSCNLQASSFSLKTNVLVPPSNNNT